MTTAHNYPETTRTSSSAGKRMLVGAAIGLAVVLFFLVQADEPDPAWSKYWMVRPLFIVPLAGAMGGLFFSLMHRFRSQGGWKKIAANIVSLLVFIIGLWLGIVLGFAGTMWN